MIEELDTTPLGSLTKKVIQKKVIQKLVCRLRKKRKQFKIVERQNTAS